MSVVDAVSTLRLWTNFRQYSTPYRRSCHVVHVPAEIPWPFPGLVLGIPRSRVLMMVPDIFLFLYLGYILITPLLSAGGYGGHIPEIQRRGYPLA